MSFKKSLLVAFIALSCILTLTGFTSPGIQYIPGEKLLRDTIPTDSTDDENVTFDKVEMEAYFPGGESAWQSFVAQNLNPNIPVDKGAPEGRYTVTIEFVVDLNGKLSALKPLTKHGFGMEQEVMRMLRKSPAWVPARQNGRNVRAYRKQPVTFEVIVEKKKKRRS